ncbi:exodeoxyribonuclease V subunit gamma [Halomonas icarae]|uniref:RecBCD enzyme subunit RecC n=1 Tax=Halomonas icarae TaxID=2691040 RepID=A0A7X4VYN5_9GAMM|nr:exodeoxyribonuclease V subunit gamma [Halomonas icarae]MDR5901861.1 exodeoxyribonuclease V subunit gamma [Halomonas icarae]NAW12641.1 exodeoxyribonuclease V subunit gamma [Halomonas icarae]
MPSCLFQETELTPGFMVIHGNRLEALRGLAVEWMRRHPLAPLENETILVQSNGISQWLKLALAEDRDQGGAGIAAALDVTLPARFLWQAYRAVLAQREGEDAVPPVSPFDKPRLVWRLMRLLPTLLDASTFAPLARFLEGDDDLRKRHQLAERLADLFDQYQVYRADWLAAWAKGEDVLISARGEARPLAEEQCWQAELWRVLREDIARAHGEAGLASSRAAVHERFLTACQELDTTHRPHGLPRRVIVFGISSLPAQTLEALAAMARVSQVLLCVHNPCRHYWADIIEHKDLLRAERRRQQRRPGMPADLAETELHLHAQPLLAAWGKQGRDYLRLLDEFDEAQAYRRLFEGDSLRIDLFESPLGESEAATASPEMSPNLLRQLQDDILELRPLQETRDTWPVVDPSRDRSLRFQVAHSALREVEILHDQLLAAFSEDPTLKPRDILVMVPDVDQYAAAVQAVFGRLDADDPRHIPFTLSDQASRHRLPLLIALESLLRLPELRLSVSDLLDLLEVPALRARFGIPESGLPTLRRWIEGAGIRWGLDAHQRQSLDLPEGLTANTWSFGLRRLLLGYAVGNAAAGPWQDVEPYDDIGGLEAALAGPLIDLVDTLETQWRTLAEPCDVATWGERLRGLLEACFLADSDQDLMALTRLEQALEGWQESAEEAELSEPLPLSVVREHWLAQIDEASLSQRFLAGAVNIATLMPMRAIPFRHVCLLGMNDADYPRVQRPLDIDLMAQDYRPGDRSRREDDRYLFLEALLSARDRLSISWVGRSIIDNTEQPPSVLLGQLRDHLARGWRLAGSEDEASGDALLAALTTEHPLQPFSIDYFRGAAPSSGGEGPGLATYAHEWRELHRPDAELEADSTTATPLAPFRQESPLTLAQLGHFLKAPVEAFYNTRLKVHLDTEATESLDSEPFTLDGLDRWQLQNALIEASRAAAEAGEPHEPAMLATLERLEREGRLAMGGFAERMRDELVEPMESLFSEYRQVLEEWPHAMQEPLDISLDLRETLGDAPALEDWLGELRVNDAMERCRVLLTTSSLVNKGKYHWKHWLTPWVAHLAGQLEGPMTTRLLSRAGGGTLAPLPAEEARAHLATIAAAWQHGMATPLPLARDAAFAWLEKGGTPQAMQRCLAGEAGDEDTKAWRALVTAYYGSGFNNDHGERGRDAYLMRQWPQLELMLRDAPLPMGSDPMGFAELAERLYAPLLRAVKKPKGKSTRGSTGKGKGDRT